MGTGRRMGFGALATLLVVVSVEGASWIAFRALYGTPFSHARVQAQAADLSLAPDPAAMTVGEAAGGAAPRIQALHPYLGFVLANGRLPPGEGAVGRLDNYGFVAGHLRFEPSADVVVVGLLGGSVAKRFGEGAGGRELAALLARAPRFAGREVELVNVALPGYKEPQQLLALSYLLALGAHFDIVVNLDGFNEVALSGENVGRGVFPFFPRFWDLQAQVPDAATLALMGRVIELRDQRQAWAEMVGQAPWRYSVTAGLVWRRWDERLAERLSAVQLRIVTAKQAELTFSAAGPTRVYADQTELARDVARVWGESSRSIAALARGHGFSYHHFLQPNQYVPGSKPMDDEERRVAYLGTHPYRASVELGYPLLRARGSELVAEGIAFHDLTGLFVSERGARYRDDCCHLNASGEGDLARAVAAAILE